MNAYVNDMRAQLLWVGVIAVITGCMTNRADFVCKDFQKRKVQIHRVWVMPPKVDVVLMSYSGKVTLLTNETAAVALQIPGLLDSRLFEKGFVVSTLTCTNEQTLTAVDQWMASLPWRRSFYAVTKKKSAEFAPTAKALAGDVDADALLFARVWGKKNTTGRGIREAVIVTVGLMGAGVGREPGAFVAGGTTWLVTGGGKITEYGFFERINLQLVLLDGRTGDVLWAVTREIKMDDQNLEELVFRTFKTFPKDR